MKICCDYVSGSRSIWNGDDWSTRASEQAFLSYFQLHRKKFVVGYQFTIEGITLRVRKITEKSDSKIVFSC